MSYKRVFEDTSFRMIAGTWQPGQTDKPHSHMSVSVAYATYRLLTAGRWP